MKTKAAVLWGLHEKWQVEDVELDPPKENEVLVKLTASGLCRSDEHLVTGDIPMPFPVVGGHEGAGKVVQAGAEVKHVAEGDSVVLSFLPACGRCSYCARGMQNLCDLGAFLINGPQLDGTYRFHARGQGVGQMCLLGTFAQWGTVSEYSCVKVDPDLPLETVVLVGCGVPTGWGTAVNAGGVRPGDTVVVYGIGGVGINAVQGAAFAGARHIVVVDPLPGKRELACQLGATHSAPDAATAQQMVTELTRGVGADQALVTVGVVTADVVQAAFAAIRKHGTVIVTGLAAPGQLNIQLSSFELTLFEKRLHGALFGGGNPFDDIPLMLDLYRSGRLKLDELITSRYRLDEVNQGYQDLLDGKNVRGVMLLEH